MDSVEPLRPVPKPVRQTRKARRLAQITARVRHYGGAQDWDALKKQVFERDRFRCVGCGLDHCATGEALEPAHLAGVKMGGRRVGSEYAIDHEMWLASLCRACHRRLDTGPDRREFRAALLIILAERHDYRYTA